MIVNILRIGNRFGKLTIIDIGDKKRYYKCKCDCGNEKQVRGDHLRSGATISCGCIMKTTQKTHGKSKIKEYKNWENMVGRCENPHATRYDLYGGRGIKICKGLRKFIDFFNVLGYRSEERKTVDRIDGNKHYSCGYCDECIKNGWNLNVRWASYSEQNFNLNRKKKHAKSFIINILGKGDGWSELPKKPKGLVYGVNDAFLRTKCDVVFHMHDLDVFKVAEKTKSSMRLTTKKANDNPNVEFYTIKPFKDIPHAKEFPLDEITEYFGVCYFTSTVEYMIAYAIWKGATTLNLYGCNMTCKEEYRDQKPGVEFWVGLAMGRGIKVNLQYKHTSLLKTRDSKIYGYLINQWRAESANFI